MDKISVASLVFGESGVGKTKFGASHPKCYIISTEPNNEWTWKIDKSVRDNVVKYEYFLPDPSDEEKTLKAVYPAILANSTLVKAINEAKDMQKKGLVESLVIDNLTYLARNKWMEIVKFEKQVTKSGEENKMAEYGALADWLYELFIFHICTFRGNICVTAHIMKEGEEAMENKIDKTIDIVPDVLGGFRDRVLGLFSNVFYLQKVSDGKSGYKYYARTNKGANVLAKNRFGLSTIIENPCYESIANAIRESISKNDKK